MPLSGANPKIARSKLALYYERMPDGRNTIFNERSMQVDLQGMVTLSFIVYSVYSV